MKNLIDLEILKRKVMEINNLLEECNLIEKRLIIREYSSALEVLEDNQKEEAFTKALAITKMVMKKEKENEKEIY